MIRRPPRPTLFPSTTLSRSRLLGLDGELQPHHEEEVRGLAPDRNRLSLGVREFVRVERAQGCTRCTIERVSEYESRSEEHTSELQSPCNLVCRLLLEKKKKT